MSNPNKILAAEFIIAVGFSSWSAIKDKQMPWPETIIKTSVAFGVLGIVGTFSPELATVVGGGFLLAQLIKVMGGKEPYTGGAPKNQHNGYGEYVSKNGQKYLPRILSF
jgi:hypothetical protein